jgi:hypothetical protein
MRFLLLTAVTAIAACGSYTDEGDGSDTLEVDANVAFTAGTAIMDARVSVDKKSAFVSGAVVTLTDDDGNSFTLDEEGNFYRAKIPGDYRRKLELKISSGADKLSAKLEGPGITFIVAPFEGTTIKLKNDPIKIEWSTKDGIRADRIGISTDNSSYHGDTNHDDGEVDIPRELLNAGDDIIHVERSNTVKLKHADDAKSTFTMSYEALSRVHFNE